MSPSDDATQTVPIRWVARAGIALLLLLGVVGTLTQSPAPSEGTDAPAASFSAERAAEHLDTLASEPRPIGSPAHAAARDYLLAELDELGFTTSTERDLSVLPGSDSTTGRAADIENIVATREGTDPSGTLILAAHYDSVEGSPGAADDGIGLATILETVRALGEIEPRNTITVLITDGEETGLFGAESYTRLHEDELGPTVLLNMEARGASGTPVTFRSTSPNGALIAALSASDGVANSAMEAAFRQLQNDTDFSRFSEADIHGLDTAIVGGGAYYHSPLDSTEHLSHASLQQMGDTTLALSLDFAQRDIDTLGDAGDQTVATTAWGLWAYPLGLELPLAVVTLLLVGALLVVQRMRGLTNVWRSTMAFVVGAVAPVVGGAVALLVWNIAKAIDPGQASVIVGEPYVAWPYQVAMMLAALATTLAIYRLLRRLLGAQAIASGALLSYSVVGLVLASALPGAASTLVLPVLSVTVGSLVVAFLPRRESSTASAVLTTALIVPAIILLPVVTLVVQLGLGLGAPASAAFLSITTMLAVPLIDRAWRTGPAGVRGRLAPLVVPAVAVVLVVAFGAAGLLANTPANTPPRQENLGYVIDAETGEAEWVSTLAPRSDWAGSLLTEAPAPQTTTRPWYGTRALSTGPAGSAEFEAPSVDLLTDTTDDAGRHVTLLITSQRGAPALGLWVRGEEGSVTAASIGDRELSTDAPTGWAFGLVFEGADAEGITITLTVDPDAGPFELLVADRSGDMGDAPGLELPDDVVIVNPAVWVSRSDSF